MESVTIFKLSLNLTEAKLTKCVASKTSRHTYNMRTLKTTHSVLPPALNVQSDSNPLHFKVNAEDFSCPQPLSRSRPLNSNEKKKVRGVILTHM